MPPLSFIASSMEFLAASILFLDWYHRKRAESVLTLPDELRFLFYIVSLRFVGDRRMAQQLAGLKPYLEVHNKRFVHSSDLVLGIALALAFLGAFTAVLAALSP